MAAIAGAGVPCGAVYNTLELLNDPDLHARGIMTKIDHPERGEVTVSGWPLRMSDSHVPVSSSPLLGADNGAIYGDWLGCSADEVADMRERNII
jgi:formyl-CoA transferase